MLADWFTISSQLFEVDEERGYLASVVLLSAFEAFAETPKTTGRI